MTITITNYENVEWRQRRLIEFLYNLEPEYYKMISRIHDHKGTLEVYLCKYPSDVLFNEISTLWYEACREPVTRFYMDDELESIHEVIK